MAADAGAGAEGARVKTEECHACRGSGRCRTCRGRGVVLKHAGAPAQRCPDCHGSGECPVCGGRGALEGGEG